MPFIEHLLCGKLVYSFSCIINIFNNWSMFPSLAKYLDFKKVMIETSFVFILFNLLFHCFFLFLELRFDSKICNFWVWFAKNFSLSSCKQIFFSGKSNDGYFPRSQLVNQCSVFCILWCKNGSWQMWLKRPHT